MTRRGAPLDGFVIFGHLLRDLHAQRVPGKRLAGKRRLLKGCANHSGRERGSEISPSRGGIVGNTCLAVVVVSDGHHSHQRTKGEDGGHGAPRRPAARRSSLSLKLTPHGMIQGTFGWSDGGEGGI